MKKILCAVLFAFLSSIVAQETIKPGLISVKNATNTYHGVTLEDPYQHLEDLSNPEVVTWMKGNANYAKSVLNSISGKQALFNTMEELMNRQSASIFDVHITDDNTYFYLKRVPGEEIGKLYKRSGYIGKESLFFDPESYKKDSGKVYTISSINLNITGDKIALALSPNGSENDEVVIFKTRG